MCSSLRVLATDGHALLLALLVKYVKQKVLDKYRRGNSTFNFLRNQTMAKNICSSSLKVNFIAKGELLKAYKPNSETFVRASKTFVLDHC